MSDGIRVVCESCGGRFSVAAKHAGRSAKCPKCGAGVEIPAAALVEAGAVVRETVEARLLARRPAPAVPLSPAVAPACANCGGMIGALENVPLWQGHRVCASCSTKLHAATAQPTAAPAVHVQVVNNNTAIAGPPVKLWSRAVAFLLSVIPGLGHVYKGKVLTGIFWFVVVSVGYAFILPGLVLHPLCALSAAMGDTTRR